MNNARTNKINVRSAVHALVFLEDCTHLLTGGGDGMIRQWRIEDGREVGQAMKASGDVWAIALSNDRDWIVSGDAVATVWNRQTRQSARKVTEHVDKVYTVDVSPDSTKFATGSRDFTASIWDISTGKRLVGPLDHDNGVISVRFSPGGDRIATTTWDVESLRVYDADSGDLLKDIPVASNARNSIAWSDDSQYIFALFSNVLSQIHSETGSFHSVWTTPGEIESLTGSVALSSNGKFIASFVGNALSFWDPYTRRRLGPVFNHAGGSLRSISVSSNNKHVATGGENGIVTIRHLNAIIPTSYLVSQTDAEEHLAGSSVADLERQVETLRRALHALEIRVDKLSRPTTQRPNVPQQVQVTPLHVSDGTYRIKSIIGDVYLTCPQTAPDTIVGQPLDPSGVFQTWIVSSVDDGAYSILGRIGNFDVPLSVGNGNQLVCALGSKHSSWTFEPRGDAYVVGNAVNTSAIHLVRRSQSILVLPRNNSPNQRWVLECISI